MIDYIEAIGWDRGGYSRVTIIDEKSTVMVAHSMFYHTENKMILRHG